MDRGQIFCLKLIFWRSKASWVSRIESIHIFMSKAICTYIIHIKISVYYSFLSKSERKTQTSPLLLWEVDGAVEWRRTVMVPDLRGGELDRVSASHWGRNLLQDQSHSAGILPQLLHEVRSAPTHLTQHNRWLLFHGAKHVAGTVNVQMFVSAHTGTKV